MRKGIFLAGALFLLFCLPVGLCAEQEYTVQKGDSLYRIARQFHTTVESLKRLNSLMDCRLKPGQKLVVSSTETETGRVTESGSTYHTEKVYHRVLPGDTLSRIARQYDISVDQIRKKNNLPGNLIKPGQKLLVKTVWTRLPAREEPIIEIAEENEAETALILTESLPVEGQARSLLEKAFCFLGAPYRLGGYSKKGIDCSGLTRKAFGEIGIDLPRTASGQFQEGQPIPPAELSAGDLLFFSTRKSGRPSHVALYLGNGLVLHASRDARKVVVDSFSRSNYFKRHFVGARRVLPQEESTDNL